MSLVLGDAVHDVVPGEDGATGLHELGDQDAVPRALQHVIGHDRRRLGEIQLQPTSLPTAGELSGIGEQQPFLLVRRQVHSGGTSGRRGSPHVNPDV